MPGGRPAVQYSQALRLLKIVEMLQHRRHLTIPQLMAEFDINRRTVQRDIAALTEVYAIEEGERTPDKYFVQNPSYVGIANRVFYTRGERLERIVDEIINWLTV